MKDAIKNMFISHVHEDDAELSGLKDLLARKGYDVRDGSINSDKPNDANDPEYIKREILAPRIKWASVVLVLISEDTHKSEYVNWEIEYAAKLGKKVVGVFVRGGKDSDIPEALQIYGDGSVCGWNAGSVVDAIESDQRPWEDAHGEVRPQQPFRRHGC